MLVVVLIKQVPIAEQSVLGEDGRLDRSGVELEMNAYCRRAVSQGVALARQFGGRCIAVTLGPPAAEDILRESVAWGADRGILVSDGAFAGSDTLATSRALAGVLQRIGPGDVVLAGRNSVDADTGQVGPQVAEMLGLPFVGGARRLQVAGRTIRAHCELDDGWRTVEVEMPAVVSVAERLIEPCKVPPAGRRAVPADRIERVRAPDLGPGPWGARGSPTVVGPVRSMAVDRRRVVLHGPVGDQVAEAVRLLREWGLPAFAAGARGAGHASRAAEGVLHARSVEPSSGPGGRLGPVSVVVVDLERRRVARELLGEAAKLVSSVGGSVVAAVGGPEPDAQQRTELAAWGADRLLSLRADAGAPVLEADLARALADWAMAASPWAILSPGTLWGREVAGRVAARLGAGLTGDAVGLGVEAGRLVSFKPAFGGRLVAAVTARSTVQMVTVRPGVLGLRAPRTGPRRLPVERVDAPCSGSVRVLDQGRDDDVDALLAAPSVVCVGQGVSPEHYIELEPLVERLGGALGATRKVTDRGWLPRSRQIGLTGHSVAPALFLALGISGRFNHMVGARGAGAIVAVDVDPRASVFEWADVGIVGDWRLAVRALLAELG